MSGTTTGPPAEAARRPVPAPELLAQAVLALRSTADLGTACAIASGCVVRAMDSAECRILRLDPRSGALRLIDESGIETSYLAEPDGPIEQVLRSETPYYESGEADRPRETLLWSRPPAAVAALPLFWGTTLFGCVLVARHTAQALSPEDRLFLQAVGDAFALALQRAELQRQLDDERGRRLELERRMRSEEESSSNLMSLVAHEIRTPLTAIKAYTETLLETLANPHTPRERFLGIISDECDRLSRLVSDILDLSRLEAGQRPLRLARVDVAAVAREVVESLRPLASRRRIPMEIVSEPSLVVEADSDLLRRLFVNLVSNAVKFSPASGQVSIRLRGSGEEWVGMVEDQGPGIPAEDLPHVFERFFRGGRSAEGQVEGTGLGLAISRGIAELHGGRMWIETPPRGGSRFCFALPTRQMASPHARRIARLVVDRADLRQLLDHTVEMVAAVMEAEIVSLMMVDPDRGDLFVAASCGLEGHKLAQRRTSVRSGVAGSVAAWGRPVLVNNIETDRRFLRLNHPQYNTKSLLSVPVEVENEVVGVVNVNNKASREPFDENDLTLLAALVERVGSAIERAYAYPDSGRVVDEAVEAVRQITRLKRDGLLGNRDLVGRARRLARALELNPQDVDVVGYVAAIRDLGMAPLQPRIHSIRGPLEDDDRRAVQQHPEVGVEMIRPLEYLGPVRDLILAHHERWDGGGYPRGLKEQEIPLGARILAVVDAFESMTAGRPFRPARTPEEAVAELRREAGRQFDPEVVEAFAHTILGDRKVA